MSFRNQLKSIEKGSQGFRDPWALGFLAVKVLIAIYEELSDLNYNRSDK